MCVVTQSQEHGEPGPSLKHMLFRVNCHALMQGEAEAHQLYPQQKQYATLF